MLPARLWQPVFIRLNRREQSLLQQTVSQIAGIFGVAPQPQQTLWEYLQAINANTGSVTPVLFFDQFEEIFTLCDDAADRQAFIAQLADVVNETLPKTVQARLQNESADARRLALEKPPRVKVVFAIRSDMLRYMHDLSDSIPGILRNRFELKGLTPEQATEAILKPAMATNEPFDCPPFEFAQAALKDILENLGARRPDQLGAEPEIESFQLQLLCSHLERRMLDAHRQGKSPLRVEVDTYGGRAGIERLLSDFYQDTIRDIPDERQRNHARVAVEDELVKNERRVSVAEASLTLGAYPVAPETLRLLVDKRLLRREERPGLGNYYELAHDTLLPPVLAFKRERTLREAAEKARLERDAEARKRRRLVALAAAFGLLALLALAAFLYAQKQRAEARRQQKKSQVNFLVTGSKLQAGEDHTLAFRLAQEAWKLDSANPETGGNMIHTFYGDLFQLGDTLYGMPHYRDFDAAWARPVAGSEKILLLSPNRHSVLLLEPDAAAPDTFPAGGIPEIADAAVAPDGGTLVTVHPQDSIARWWSAEKGMPPKLLVHEGPVLSVAFSPDGGYFTTNSGDTRQRLWSARGELLATYQNIGTVDLLHTAAFSPDSRQLLVLEDDQTAKLYPVQPGEKTVEMKEPNGTIVDAAFLPGSDGVMLLCAGPDGVVNRVRIFDRQGRKRFDGSLPFSGDLFNTAVPGAGGKQLLLTATDSTAGIWDLASKKYTTLGLSRERHTGYISKAVFASGERLIASGSTDKTARLWQNGRLALVLPHRDRIADLFFSNGSRYLVATTSGNKVRLWSLRANAIVPLQTADIPVFSALIPGAPAVYAKDLQDRWYCWNFDGRPSAFPVWLDTAGLRHATPWGDGRTALIQMKNGELQRRDLLNGNAVRLGIRPCSDLTPIVAAETNLIALCRSDSVEILQADGRLLALLPYAGAGVSSLCWSADGQMLFIALGNARVEIWSPATKTTKPLEGMNLPVSAMAAAPNGKSMLFGTQGYVYRWDITANPPVVFLSGRHDEGSPVSAVTWSPDSRFIATAALDGTVALWDYRGRWLHTFRFSDAWGAAYRLQFSVDGRYLLSQHYRQTLFLWPLDPSLLERALDRQRARPLSPAERIMYDLN